MKLTLILCATFLASSAAEPEKHENRNPSLSTAIEKIQRLVALFKVGTEEMFAEALPTVNALALDHPEYSDVIHGLVEVITDAYNNKRINNLGEGLINVYTSVVLPIISGQDQCVQMINNEYVTLLQPKNTAVSAVLTEYYLKIKDMFQEAKPVFDSEMDTSLDLVKDAIEDGKVCQKKEATDLVQCSYKILNPLVNELSMVPEHPGFTDLRFKIFEILKKMNLGWSNIRGLLYYIVKGGWYSFVECEDLSI